MYGYPVFEALRNSLNIISQRRTDRQMREAGQEFLLGLETTKAGWATTRQENIQKARAKSALDLAKTKRTWAEEDRILSLPEITSQWFTGKTQELGREPTWDETSTWHKYAQGYRPPAAGTAGLKNMTPSQILRGAQDMANKLTEASISEMGGKYPVDTAFLKEMIGIYFADLEGNYPKYAARHKQRIANIRKLLSAPPDSLGVEEDISSDSTMTFEQLRKEKIGDWTSND